MLQQPVMFNYLRWFPEVLNYYRRFIPSTVNLQASLNDILYRQSKNYDAMIKWTNSTIQALNEYGESITCATLIVTLFMHPTWYSESTSSRSKITASSSRYKTVSSISSTYPQELGWDPKLLFYGSLTNKATTCQIQHLSYILHYLVWFSFSIFYVLAACALHTILIYDNHTWHDIISNATQWFLQVTSKSSQGFFFIKFIF